MRIALAHNLRRSAGEEEAELDSRETIDAIGEMIASLGHAVEGVEVSRPVGELCEALERCRPDLVFNIAEGRVGRFREAFYPALFEQLGLPYTGSDAGVLALAMNKSLTKSLLARAVTTPGSILVRDPRAVPRLPSLGLAYPLIVKPNEEGSSKGITQESVVEEGEQLVRVAAESLRRYPAGILIEEYIDGLDVAVGWVDGLSPATGGILAPAAYRYQPAGNHRIYDLALKRTGEDRVHAEVPADLEPAIMTRLTDVSRLIFDELEVTGFGRADFRVTPGGAIHFIEMNPLPSLAPGPEAEIYLAAALLGHRPADVLASIIDAAARRFRIRG